MSAKPKLQQKYEAQFVTAKMVDVMQYWANNYKGDAVQRWPDGSVNADWWVDPIRGEVMFRIWVKP